MIDTITFNGRAYPKFQSTGNAMRFALPFALEVVTGARVLDIGYGKDEWKFPGSIGVDINDAQRGFHAMNLPEENVDGIVSSHLLEHVSDWVGVLDYWTQCLRSGGVLFLYLPHPHQEYWLPWNNRRHVSSLRPSTIKKYLHHSGAYVNIFVSKRDANDSFTAFAEKA